MAGKGEEMSKKAFKKRLVELGYVLSREDIDQVFISFKQLNVAVEPLIGEKSADILV